MIAESRLRKAFEDPSPEHRIALLGTITAKDATDLRLIGGTVGNSPLATPADTFDLLVYL